MMMPKSPFQNLVKYVRSPLGFLLAIAIIIAIVVITVLTTNFSEIGKYVVVGVFFITIIAVVIWVIRRTPKTPHGMVATEDYYALEAYLEHLKAYGTETHTETKREMLKKKKMPKEVLPPPTENPKLTNGEGQ